VEFTVEAHEDRVMLCVADGSSVIPEPRDPDLAGGRELMLIEALSSRWGVNDHEGGKQVWVELTPSPGGRPDQSSASGRDNR